MTKLLIVEDDSFMVQALQNGLQNFGLAEIYSASTSSIAMQQFRRVNPTVCLIDVELKAGPTGVDVAHAMRRLNPDVGIVFLTSLADPRLVDSAIPDLPKGSIYLMKSRVENLAEVIEAINLVEQGDQKAINSWNSPSFLDLTKVQFEIIRLVAEGLSNAEIAKIRVTTIKSTEHAIARLAKRLGVTNSSNTSQRVLLARAYAKLTGKV